MKKILLIFTFVLISNLIFSQDKEEQYPLATIYPHQIYGHKINHFFLDLKGGENKVSNKQKAILFFQNNDMDGIRINIHGEKKKPAHPALGIVDSTYYVKMLKSIRNAKAARGDKPFYIFASKKLTAKTSFPDWVKDKDGVIPSKYVDLLIDYFKFMKAKGISIDYLGIDNEINFNEGNITPDKFNEIVILFREKCKENHIAIPKIVGPDRYEPMGNKKNCWIRQFLGKEYGNQLDIYGTHYYPEHRYKNRLIYELGLIGNRPFWATEPHWDRASKTGSIFNSAEQAICTLWDQTDLGMSAFMWWGDGSGKSKTQYMRNEVSIPIHGAQPVLMTDYDGISTKTYGNIQSRAFLHNNILEVYFINNSMKQFKEFKIKINSEKIKKYINVKQFTLTGPNKGVDTTITPSSDNSFTCEIPAISLTHCTIELR